MQTEATEEMAAHVNAFCRGGTSEKPVVARVISDSVLFLPQEKNITIKLVQEGGLRTITCCT